MAAESAHGVMDLYYAPGSSALITLLALEEAGASYRLHRMNLAAGDQQDEAFLALNPMGRVPVLIDGGFVLTEVAAILRYVATCYPEAGLWPLDSRSDARCAEWIAWSASALHPAMAHVRKPARYATTPDGQAEVVARARTTVLDLFRQAERRLGRSPWVAGDSFCLADLYTLFFWQWASAILEDDGLADAFPAWLDHGRRLAARPVIAAVMAREGVVLP